MDNEAQTILGNALPVVVVVSCVGYGGVVVVAVRGGEGSYTEGRGGLSAQHRLLVRGNTVD